MASRKGTSKPSPAQIKAWAAGNRTGAAIILESGKHPDSLEMRWARMIESKSAGAERPSRFSEGAARTEPVRT